MYKAFWSLVDICGTALCKLKGACGNGTSDSPDIWLLSWNVLFVCVCDCFLHITTHIYKYSFCIFSSFNFVIYCAGSYQSNGFLTQVLRQPMSSVWQFYVQSSAATKVKKTVVGGIWPLMQVWVEVVLAIVSENFLNGSIISELECHMHNPPPTRWVRHHIL